MLFPPMEMTWKKCCFHLVVSQHGNDIVSTCGNDMETTKVKTTSFPPMEIMWKWHCLYLVVSHGNHQSHYFQATFKLHSKQAMETIWKPHAIHVDTIWFPDGHHMVSTWTPHGFHVDTMCCSGNHMETSTKKNSSAWSQLVFLL